MADIRVLPRSLAELIAAGEVVERPASVIKELVENSIDAGATKITVEIQHGGITYMRVTDNGCGIKREQVKTAFLRHATSKIQNENDLFKIGTLGFRGEALASISAVAKVEMMTKTADAESGVSYIVEGGEEISFEEVGCPTGTTIVIRDLFFNTPARMKFLKKDVAEAVAVSALIDAIALSHPEISIRYIKDARSELVASGDGKLASAIYSVLGREFSSGLIPVDSETDGIRVSGMICKPVHCVPTRSRQYFFLNHRYIRSGIIAKALDQAYKNSIMVGKFPAGVLNIEIASDKVDVNVHPAKTEVRFSNERTIFDAVYYAAKNALAQGDTRPQLELKPKAQPVERMTTEQYRSLGEANRKPTLAERVYLGQGPSMRDFGKPIVSDKPINVAKEWREEVRPSDTFNNKSSPIAEKKTEKTTESVFEQYFEDTKEERFETATFIPKTEIEFKYIGEVFRTYIVVQYKGSIYFIDKHAAHERLLYEKLKKEGVKDVQALLSPVSVTLSREEHRAVVQNLDLLSDAGFEIEEFGTVSVLVRAVPACLAKNDVMFLISDIASNLVKTGKAETDLLDDLFHNIACRSAIKGGNYQSDAELEAFAKQILSSDDIMYCPHGRPVAFELTRSELEKQFGRSK